jgi:diacylglycerol O-acyltransferase / wax synthase
MNRRLTPMDTMFLYGETPSSMMHVASLLLFDLPEKTPETFVRDLFEEIRANPDVQQPWNLKLKHPKLKYHPANTWVLDEDLDIDYHVRRSALPAPGDERELGVLISRLHSHPLDLTRPPWEMHLIEGLEGDRFAMYIKVHHSLIDGYSGLGLLARSLAGDPAEDKPIFFGQALDGRQHHHPSSGSKLPSVPGMARFAVREAGAAVALGKGLVNVGLRRRGKRAALVGSLQAPHTILNGAVSRNRRFAGQQYDLALLRRVGKKYDATLNDVVLSILGGGLRTFLAELDELPDKPLIGFLPVSVHPKGDSKAGNSTGAVLASLATDVADPVERLKAVVASTRLAKGQLEGMPQEAALAYSAALLAPHLIPAAAAIVGVPDPLPFTFNVCISNVPGPQETLYLHGARLRATYPVSIPTHGMALNVTLHSYDGKLNFGFVGCRDALPGLQRLAVYTTRALDELAQAAGV